MAFASFVVGTGGARLYGFWNPPYASRARILKHGVLRLSLDDGVFAWQFIRVDGGVADAGKPGAGGRIRRIWHRQIRRIRPPAPIDVRSFVH